MRTQAAPAATRHTRAALVGDANGDLSVMERSARRIVDDDWLAGLWLRQVSSDDVFYAPVRLPDGAFGLLESGALDLPAMTFSQALARRARALAVRAVWLDAGELAGD